MNRAARTRVAIVGCGFGGLEAVRRLSPSETEITLIDRTNHHLFQPLLYQVATADVAAPAVSGPIRHVLRREMSRGNLNASRFYSRALALQIAARHAGLPTPVHKPA